MAGLRRFPAAWAAIFVIGIAIAVAGPRPSDAEEIEALSILDAPLDFSADYSLTSNDQTWRGTIIHAPGRERRDFATALGVQAVLLRRDIDQAAVLWPERKWYLSTSLRALAGMFGGAEGVKFNRRRDGTETISGERCTRYQVDGDFTGRVWFTSDGILMRAAGILRLNGRERTIATQLTHVKRGPIDADDFELPLGYHGISVSPTLLGTGD
jgi:hypothetical protein